MVPTRTGNISAYQQLTQQQFRQEVGEISSEIDEAMFSYEAQMDYSVTRYCLSKGLQDLGSWVSFSLDDRRQVLPGTGSQKFIISMAGRPSQVLYVRRSRTLLYPNLRTMRNSR